MFSLSGGFWALSRFGSGNFVSCLPQGRDFLWNKSYDLVRGRHTELEAWEESSASAFLVLTIGAARLYNIGSQVICLFLAFTGHVRFL